MTSHLFRRLRAMPARSAVGTVAIVLLLGSAFACDRLLDVQAPSRVPASTLDNPAQAQLIVNGAQADFECAFASYVVVSGMMEGELEDATLSAGRWDYDRRTVQSSDAYGPNQCNDGSFLGVYTPLSIARYSGDHAVADLQGWTDDQVQNRHLLIATASAYAGYSLTLLGEGFCSAAIDVGPQLMPDQLLDSAAARFSLAITEATAAGPSATNILNLALVGRARAFLDLGNAAAAAADAQQVPADFDYDATYSSESARRENYVYQQINKSPFNTVGQLFRDVRYDGTPDPRVPVQFDAATRMFDNRVGQYVQMKYQSIDAPIPLATGTEAQLIIAEAQGGQTAIDIINSLHAAAGLPPYTNTDPDSIQAQIVYERTAAFFLDGHHLGDVNRLHLPLYPAAGTAYPSDPGTPGTSAKGGFYGQTTRFPLPDKERFNNPNIPSSTKPGC